MNGTNPPSTHTRDGMIVRRRIELPPGESPGSLRDRRTSWAIAFGQDIGAALVLDHKAHAIDGVTVMEPLAEGEDCWIHVSMRRWPKDEAGVECADLRAMIWRRPVYKEATPK